MLLLLSNKMKIRVFVLSDLEERFFQYPDYQESVKILISLEEWTSQYPGEIHVKKMPMLPHRTRDSLPDKAQSLAKQLGELKMDCLSVFFNAFAAASLFKLAGVPIAFEPDCAVPGHFVSTIFPDDAPFPLLRQYIPPPELATDPERLQNAIHLNHAAILKLGVIEASVFDGDVAVLLVMPNILNNSDQIAKIRSEISDLLQPLKVQIEFEPYG